MIVGIGGVSRSGKSALAQKIRAWFPNAKVTILDQDDFIRDVEQIPRIKGEIDWECPESIDFERYLTAVLEAARKSDLVIAEGLMAYYDQRLVTLMDKKIFLTIPYRIFVRRKRNDMRWGPFPEWYIDHIWESYLKYGMPPRGDTGILMLPGDVPFDKKKILDFLAFNP